MPSQRYSRNLQALTQQIIARQATIRHPLRTRDLDFLILAGCSCLLTFLYHPVLDQLQDASSRSSSKPSTSTSRSASTSNNLGSYSAIEPKRQRFQIEEEEA